MSNAIKLLLPTALIIMICIQPAPIRANPLPSIVSVQPPKQQAETETELPTSQKQPEQPPQQQQSQQQQPIPPATVKPQPIVKTIRGSSFAAEKLKRGLTNFMNQLNPGPHFVPPAPAMSMPQVVSPAQVKSAQAEPATIISGDPTAEALIKGPSRLAQTRQIGGPLRWG